MPAANQAFTEELTDTYTYEAYPLGTLRYQSPGEVFRANNTHFGERTWVFVHNDEGGSLVVGDIIEMGNDAGNGTSGYSPYRAVQSNTSPALHYRTLGVAAPPTADAGYVRGQGQFRYDYGRRGYRLEHGRSGQGSGRR